PFASRGALFHPQCERPRGDSGRGFEGVGYVVLENGASCQTASGADRAQPFAAAEPVLERRAISLPVLRELRPKLPRFLPVVLRSVILQRLKLAALAAFDVGFFSSLKIPQRLTRLDPARSQLVGNVVRHVLRPGHYSPESLKDAPRPPVPMQPLRRQPADRRVHLVPLIVERGLHFLREP